MRGGGVSTCGLVFGCSAYLCRFSIPKELEDEFKYFVMASLDLGLLREVSLASARVQVFGVSRGRGLSNRGVRLRGISL
jgi:hypothetical protein